MSRAEFLFHTQRAQRSQSHAPEMSYAETAEFLFHTQRAQRSQSHAPEMSRAEFLFHTQRAQRPQSQAPQLFWRRLRRLIPAREAGSKTV